jgi:hypothetical protein
MLSVRLEMWKGGTLERACDGTTDTSRKEPRPCSCAILGQEGGDRDCEYVTRFRVILPRLPGLGTWLLTTSGYTAATTLPATFELLAGMATGWTPAVLRADQRSAKVRMPDGKVTTNRFVVPVLDTPGITIGELVAGIKAPEPVQIEAGPVGAAATAAARRAQIEARAATTREDAPTVLEGVAVVPTAAPRPAAAPTPSGAAAGATCGALPVDSSIGLTLPCVEPVEGHNKRVHKSVEGSWPA